jgi:hypothetical protein
MKITYPLSLASVATIASGHAIMQSFNSLEQGKGIYMPSDDGPIQDVTSPSMACNGAPNGFFRVSENRLYRNLFTVSRS